MYKEDKIGRYLVLNFGLYKLYTIDSFSYLHLDKLHNNWYNRAAYPFLSQSKIINVGQSWISEKPP